MIKQNRFYTELYTDTGSKIVTVRSTSLKLLYGGNN